MKSLAMSLAAFGALGCSLALADPVLSLPPGGGGEGAVVLSGAELDVVRGGSAPAGYRLNSKSVDYYTEGDTYKVTDKSRFKTNGEDSSSSYSTKTKEVRRETAPAGSKLNTRSVDYYTDTREEYDPETESWNMVEGDTYKATTRSSYRDTPNGPQTSYSTMTKKVRTK